MPLFQEQIIYESFVDHAHALGGCTVHSGASQPAIHVQRIEVVLEESFNVLHGHFRCIWGCELWLFSAKDVPKLNRHMWRPGIPDPIARMPGKDQAN